VGEELLDRHVGCLYEVRASTSAHQEGFTELVCMDKNGEVIPIVLFTHQLLMWVDQENLVPV